MNNYCLAWPQPHELSEWASIFSAALGITQAIAAIEVAAWQARGSKLDELPAASPRPNLPPKNGGLTDAELAELQAADPTLIGNRLEAMFKAIGIPTCGGCEARRDYLNKCHQWILTPW